MQAQAKVAEPKLEPAGGSVLPGDPSVYARLLPLYVQSLPGFIGFVAAAAGILAILGHPLLALGWAAGSIAADVALNRMYRRWLAQADTTPSEQGIRKLGAWSLARGCWSLLPAAAVCVIYRHPVDAVFLLLVCGGMLFVAVMHAVYSLRLYVMGAIPPVLAGLAGIYSVQQTPQDLALFGALLWIVGLLVVMGQNARGLARREIKARAEKNRMIAELQAAVAEAAVRQAEADAAREAARRAALAKSTFLATMSHEIRTPLNGVLGMAQALERSKLTIAQRGQVATIQTSGEMLLLVLNDILDLCEIDAGTLEIAKGPCDLRVLLDEMRQFWACTAQDRGLELTLKLDEGLPAFVLLDRARVRQILFNLVGNALKFTQAGGVLVVIRAAQQAGAHRLFLEVTDTGVGVEPERLARIFEAFSKADDGHGRRTNGPGMGLALCKQLAGLMGGDVTLSSRPGKGSTFRVSLPLEAAAAPEVDFAAEGARSAAPHRLSILAADDNPTNLLVLEQLLGAFGYTIWKARDGREALEALTTQPFDLVLMDIQMPEMTGDQVLKAVREAPGPNQTTPLIAVTADAMNHGAERYIDLGFAAFVAKPLHVQTLVSAMMAAVANSDEAEDGEDAAAV